MSIYQERDVVLFKINALAHRDQGISYPLLIKELQAEFNFNRQRCESLVWYLKEHRYVTREGGQGEWLVLTSEGLDLIDKGGFVELRTNQDMDLEEEVKSLKSTVAQLKIKVNKLEEKGRRIFPKEKSRTQGVTWLGFLLAGLILILLLLSVSCTTDNYPSYRTIQPSVEFKIHEIIKTPSLGDLSFLKAKRSAIIDVERYADAWYFFMVKDTAKARRQHFYYATDFPKTKLDDYIRNGYLIQDLDYQDGVWTAILEKNASGNQTQLLQIGKDDSMLDKYNQDGYYTSDISYSPNLGWIYILENGQRRNLPLLFSGEKFPGDKISKYWAQNYDITKVKHLNGYWCVLMEKLPTGIKQNYNFYNHLPSNEIYESECQNSIISQVEKAEGTDEWLVLLTRD